MNYQFKVKVFVNHKHVGWLYEGVKRANIVLNMRNATKFDSSIPSIYGAAMVQLELPEPEKGAVPPVTFQFIKV